MGGLVSLLFHGAIGSKVSTQGRRKRKTDGRDMRVDKDQGF